MTFKLEKSQKHYKADTKKDYAYKKRVYFASTKVKIIN